MRKFQGATTALIVPLYEDCKIHWEDLRRLTEYQLENGIHNLLVGGTTGQSPTVHEEQRDINKTVKKIVDGKIPVIFGTGHNDTATAEEETLQAWLDEADATLHVMGYYNKPSQLGVIDYFERIAQAAPTPVIMYNIPPRGAAEYKPETMIYLAKRHRNIIGVKEASGEPAIEVAKRTRELADKYNLAEFLILSGDDDKTFELMSNSSVRGDGVISVMSNLLPHAYVEFTELFLEGEVEKARELNEILSPLNGMVTVKCSYPIRIRNDEYLIENDAFRNPAPVQTAAYILGMIESPQLRSPLVKLPKDGVEEVGKRLTQVYRNAPELFDPIKQFYKVDVGKKLEIFR